jgi:hypothetical protein
MIRTIALCAYAAIIALCARPSFAGEALHRRVLLLPVEFNVFQDSTFVQEIVPEQTEAARLNLGDAAREALLAHGDFELDAMPRLSPDEDKTLHRHVALARLITAQAEAYRRRPWRERRAQFNRDLGNGLSFLHDRTGAGYALLVTGSQVTRCFFCAPLTPNGQKKRTEVDLVLIDLADGNVSWFNSVVTFAGFFGALHRDVSERNDAREVISKLLVAYPDIPALTD